MTGTDKRRLEPVHADMNDEFVHFAQLANPHSWLLVADNLHTQALHLQHSQRGNAIWTRIESDGWRNSWDATNRAVFLLGGFALENAIKAFLVYENPEWISNGRLARPLRSHSLVGLQEQSEFVPNKNRYVWVLEEFEDGLESWARYPCALNAEESDDEALMDDDLWVAYLKLMKSYGNRLTKLLSKPWRGPHGTGGQWTFEGGDWLGYTPATKATEFSSTSRSSPD